MEEEQPISDLEDPSEEELQQMKSEYEMMKKQQQEIESLQKFQFFKKTQVDLSHLVTLNTAQTITGTKPFTNQVTAQSFKEPEGTNQQIMLPKGTNMNHFNFRPYYDAECVDGIRISRNLAKQTLDQNSSIYLGCSNTQESGAISGQWSITASKLNTLLIHPSSDSQHGLAMMSDRLMFNDLVIYRSTLLTNYCSSITLNTNVSFPSEFPTQFVYKWQNMVFVNMVLTIYETSFSQKVVTLSIPQDIRPTLEKQYLPLQEISLSQGSAYPTNVHLRINDPTDGYYWQVWNNQKQSWATGNSVIINGMYSLTTSG
ncbi:MAG: hypothetical protein EZS28_016054 [Streblomastix strix]|uniref:Uncharacterized protein n=1 Tax=Streblomastix strix TaxID=222440 RepID=A0A5J4W0E8_9EUKA|nr:MAG: hypothetical protein EZS28_016054 [Streblomastix strix]